MSFIEQVAAVNECGTIVNSSNNGCTYDAFMSEMLDIENMINEAVNTFNRLVNTDAITALLEDGGEVSTQVHKDNLLSNLKTLWTRIVEAFFKFLDKVWDYIYEQVVLQTKFIEKHKDEIMKTTMIYKKTKSTVSENGKKISSFNMPVSEPDIRTYSNILKPNFIEPIMSNSELEKYMGDNDRVDGKKLYEYYKDEILGNLKNIDIDGINAGKANLIKGVKDRYNDVKTRKAKIISIRKKYQIPPKELTPEAVKEFQAFSMAQIESLKAYNKVTLDYCKEATSILKKFIKNSKEQEEK